jgi:hypothetical protein
VLDAWAGEGRTDPPHLFVSCFIALGEDAPERLKSAAHRYWGTWEDPARRDAIIDQLTVTTPDRVRELVAHADAAGYDEVDFFSVTDDLEELDRLLAAFDLP